MTSTPSRKTAFVTVAISEAARDELRSATAWVIGLAGTKMSAGDAMRTMLEVARRHPEEVKAEAARLAAGTDEHARHQQGARRNNA